MSETPTAATPGPAVEPGSQVSAYDAAVAAAHGLKPVVDLYGAAFTLHGEIDPIDASELARGAQFDSNTTEGGELIAEVLRAAFGDDQSEGMAEYRRMRRHLKAVKRSGSQGEADVYMTALRAVIEASVTFPTKQRSPSPQPASSASTGSPDAGSPPAAPTPQPAPPALAFAVVDEDGFPPEWPQQHQHAAPAGEPLLVNIGRPAS